MLDYGFTEVMCTSNFRSIQNAFRKPRCFSFCCKLASLTPAGGMREWSKTACEYMQNLIQNKKLLLAKRVSNVIIPQVYFSIDITFDRNPISIKAVRAAQNLLAKCTITH